MSIKVEITHVDKLWWIILQSSDQGEVGERYPLAYM